MPLPFILGAAGVAIAALTATEVAILVAGAFALGVTMSSKSKEETVEKVREAGFGTLALFIDLTDKETYGVIRDRMKQNKEELSEEENIKKMMNILKQEYPSLLTELEKKINDKIVDISKIYERDVLKRLEKLKDLKELKKYLVSIT